MGIKLVQFRVAIFPKMRMIGKGIVLLHGGMKPGDRSIENLWEGMAQDGSLIMLAISGRYGGNGRVHLPRY